GDPPFALDLGDFNIYGSGGVIRVVGAHALLVDFPGDFKLDRVSVRVGPIDHVEGVIDQGLGIAAPGLLQLRVHVFAGDCVVFGNRASGLDESFDDGSGISAFGWPFGRIAVAFGTAVIGFGVDLLDRG